MSFGDAGVSSLPRDMLLAYLQGCFTSDAQKVSRVIIAGGGPASATSDIGASSLTGVRELDSWGLQLGASGIPVDVLPGKSDPTTANWPQRPFHSSLFPKWSSTRLCNTTPNPYAAGHGRRFVIGTDGENVRDLCRSMLYPSQKAAKGDNNENFPDSESYEPVKELEALEHTLKWSHMCPTGPDSVPTVPHGDMDPMVLDSTPHLYFSGNSTKFATKMVENKERGTMTRLVCVPKFAESGEAVLVNLETLDVELLRFKE